MMTGKAGSDILPKMKKGFIYQEALSHRQTMWRKNTGCYRLHVKYCGKNRIKIESYLLNLCDGLIWLNRTCDGNAHRPCAKKAATNSIIQDLFCRVDFIVDSIGRNSLSIGFDAAYILPLPQSPLMSSAKMILLKIINAMWTKKLG